MVTTYVIYTDTDEVKGWDRKKINFALKKEKEFGREIQGYGGYIVSSDENFRRIPVTRVICCEMSLEELLQVLGGSELPRKKISTHRNGYV